MFNNLTVNMAADLISPNGLAGLNVNANLPLNPELLNYLNSMANQTQPEATTLSSSSSNRKATSKEFLKQIPRIIITKHSSLFYEVIVECTITPPSTSSNSSNSSNTTSSTILQFDAIAAEFGPSPPYSIQGALSSFLDCESNIKAWSKSTPSNNPIQSESHQIAYMMRGKGITFVDRALYAQMKGSDALIIANHVSVWPYIMKDSKNVLSQSKIPLTIPVVMIKQSDHGKLAPHIKSTTTTLQQNSISCRIHAKNKNENKDDNACIICCEPFQINETAMRLPFCFHTFHEKCALVWLNKHNTCPYCRRELPMEDQEEEQQRRRTGRAYASSGNVDTRSNGDSFYG